MEVGSLDTKRVGFLYLILDSLIAVLMAVLGVTRILKWRSTDHVIFLWTGGIFLISAVLYAIWIIRGGRKKRIAKVLKQPNPFS